MRAAAGMAVLLLAATAVGDDGVIRTVEADGFRVRVDPRSQVLRLSIPEERGWAHDDQRGSTEAEILPTLPPHAGQFVSAAVLAEKAKQFDDGLYAAVEFAAQKGVGAFAGKAYLLKSLAERLAPGSPSPSAGGAVVTILAAARLGQIPLILPPALEAQVQERMRAFVDDALRSRPIGFYTWSRSLEAIFQQDRMLQTELQRSEEIASVLAALRADAKLAQTYTRYLRLVERLTNPLAQPDLRPLVTALDAAAPEKGVWFFPPSVAHETELVKRLYGDRPIPDGFDLMNELIRAVRNGAINLTPTDASGWYDHQTWALEPLLIPDRMPEAARLRFDATYERALEELFKGILARTRETHVKQLEIPSVGAAAPGREPVVITVRPALTVEPLAAHYLRRAMAYRFVRDVLAEAFGADGVNALRRWTPVGPLDAPGLGDELVHLERLFVGAYVLSCRQIGCDAPLPKVLSDVDPAAAVDAFSAWAASLAADADLKCDGRMMVPVFFDLQRQKTKVWVFLGWSARRLSVEFDAPPRTETLDADGKPAPPDAVRVRFDGEHYGSHYPVMAEVYVTKILNRKEFAAHCDQYKTRGEILKNLK